MNSQILIVSIVSMGSKRFVVKGTFLVRLWMAYHDRSLLQLNVTKVHHYVILRDVNELVLQL